MPERSEDGAKGMERFQAWIGRLGDAVVNPGIPLGISKTVSAGGVADGGVAYSLVGFSVVQADSMDVAVEMAGECPFLEMGTIEVAEVMGM